MTKFSVYDCSMIELDKHHSDRKGNLTVVENGVTLPFDVKRVYYLYDVPGGESRWGGFMYYCDNDNLNNCVNAPIQDNSSYGQGYDFYRPVSASPKLNNCYYNDVSVQNHQGTELPPSVEEQLEALGSNWVSCNDHPGIMPLMTRLPYLDATFCVATNNCDDFYFESSGKVEKTLVVQTRQSSVYLTWESDGGLIDYYQVMRRVQGQSDWDVIADNLTEMAYEDTSVSPILDYEYKVRSAVDCEGTRYAETDVMPGACEHTGMVEGYLRFEDGTAISGMEIQAIKENGDIAQRTTTDSKGYYVIKGLSYEGQTFIKYKIAPISNPQVDGPISLQTASYPVTFNDQYNYFELNDFVVTSGVKFSGVVLYEGTRIPVRGVGFTVNGKQIYNASGSVLETDPEGKFSFYVNTSVKLDIKPIMNGHTFKTDQVCSQVFTDKVSDYHFYDATRVKLTGRMVGGKTQGDLPLDNSLSRNNLGDNLMMVLSLEGDNVSYLVYDVQHPNKAERDTVFYHKSHDGQQYKTTMHTTRKRIELKPDPVTGEYVAWLPPVKWKVQQLSCSGYPTLFASGKTSDVIDLTDALEMQCDTNTMLFTTVSIIHLHCSPTVRLVSIVLISLATRAMWPGALVATKLMCHWSIKCLLVLLKTVPLLLWRRVTPLAILYLASRRCILSVSLPLKNIIGTITWRVTP